MDIVFRTSSSGYVSFGEGSIARFELPGDEHGELQLTTVATGLEYPRGIALREDTLFVAELGPLPCNPGFPVCTGPTLNERFPEAGERRIVRSSRGRVLAFRVHEDGALSDRRVVLADLPFATTEHGVNDVVLGPDGRIFVAIETSIFSTPPPLVHASFAGRTGTCSARSSRSSRTAAARGCTRRDSERLRTGGR